ncbi:putative ripening-related protein 2 [Rutidosis leptorrhynchoides]|uniref:putative ripening-related protein 2 n=1 Tax=Rutidosis leptorrhynchoides TaxID=125765 RepID=UPI003A99A3D5
MMISNFEKGGDNGRAECDSKYHSNESLIVSLPTIYYQHGLRCNDDVTIFYNNIGVSAIVIDECDCPQDTFVASQAVWEAFKIPKSAWGEIEVSWGFSERLVSG